MSGPRPGRPGAGGGGATSPAPIRLTSDPQPLAVLLAAVVASWPPAPRARAHRALARLEALGSRAVLEALDALEEREAVA
jgi:hypothetical protein